MVAPATSQTNRKCPHCTQDLGTIIYERSPGSEITLDFCAACFRTFSIPKAPRVINKTLDFIGVVEKKIENKVRRGAWRGDVRYELILEKEPNEESAKKIHVFKGLVKHEGIWKAIENNACLHYKYLFKCANSGKNLQLVDWKELER